jgi:hypothetical protein
MLHETFLFELMIYHNYAAEGVPLSHDGHPTRAYVKYLNEAMFAILDGGAKEAACGFFISPTHAITVYHDDKPLEHAELKGVSLVGDDNTRIVRTFVVDRVHPSDHIMVLRLTSKPLANQYLPIPAVPKPRHGLMFRKIYKCAMGVIDSSKYALAGVPDEIRVVFTADETAVKALGPRIIVYLHDSGYWDDGAYVVLAETGEAVAIHCVKHNVTSAERTIEVEMSETESTRYDDLSSFKNPIPIAGWGVLLSKSRLDAL